MRIPLRGPGGPLGDHSEAAALAGGAAFAAGDDVEARQTETAFADAAQAVQDAIVNRGYHIEHEGDVGSMLKRTGDTVGASKTVYENAGFLQFCSAVLSRGAMEADPSNIAFCPYVVFAYETPDAPGKVHVGFRRLTPRGSEQSIKAIAYVNALLDDIVREAAGQ